MEKKSSPGASKRPMEAFTLFDVPIYTGVSRPTLQKWIDRGWVRASARTDAGPEGSPLFTRVDLYHIAFLQKVKESGFSRDLAVEKINVYAICRAWDARRPEETVGIAFSRTQDVGADAQGAWIISEALDQEAGWDSLNLIGERLKEGADDFYILNFSRLANRIDQLIAQASGL